MPSAISLSKRKVGCGSASALKRKEGSGSGTCNKPGCPVWDAECNLLVEATGSPQRRVQRVRPVRRTDYNNLSKNILFKGNFSNICIYTNELSLNYKKSRLGIFLQV
jgi:hypothetical protein